MEFGKASKKRTLEFTPQLWKPFKLGGNDGLFDVRKGKRLTSADQTEGTTPYIGAVESNNGLSNRIGQAPIHEGNTISLSYNGSVGEAFYQPEPYWATDDVNALYLHPRYGQLTPAIGLFICTILRQEKYRYSYGRKWTVEGMESTVISLPATSDGEPDWQFMEDFISSLHHEPITTANEALAVPLETSSWKFFLLNDLCTIDMGNKMDFSAMTAEDLDINFVGRSADNNGVMGRVDLVDDIDPYPAGAVTVALGGSLGSTFLQIEPFYTSQNVSVLQFDTKVVSAPARLFLANMIQFESRFKYFPFGRELNKYIRTIFGFDLPIQRTEKGTPIIDPEKKYHPDGYIPNWQFMDGYMRSLPYGDRLPELKESATSSG